MVKICRIDFYCRTVLKTEPETDGSFNSDHLERLKGPELFQELCSRDRHDILDVKNTRAQKAGFDIYFESRRAGTRRVRDDGHKGSVLFCEMDAEDKAGSYLGGKPKVN